MNACGTSHNAQSQFNLETITDIMAHLFVDVHLTKAKLTLFLEGNTLLIAFTVSD